MLRPDHAISMMVFAKYYHISSETSDSDKKGNLATIDGVTNSNAMLSGCKLIKGLN